MDLSGKKLKKMKSAYGMLAVRLAAGKTCCGKVEKIKR